MTIFDYALPDLLFAHWLQRKRDQLRTNAPVPAWLDQRLDQLRPVRNPDCSVFVLDEDYQ